MGMVRNVSMSMAAAMMMTAACSSPYLPEVDVDDECLSIKMMMPSAEFDELALTKSEANVGSTQIDFVWSEDDVVGIFPETGSQLYFSMAEGAGKSNAVFDGGGWAMKKTAKYYSYFPFHPDFYMDKEAVPMSFVGQVQHGNGNQNHADLGSYNYMVAEGSYENGAMSFKYERLAALFRFRIPVQAGTYTSLRVIAGTKCIASEATFNALEIDYALNDPIYTDKVMLGLKNLSLASDGTLVGWMMLPPFNILNDQLTIELTKSDGTVVTSSVAGKNYLRTYVYDNTPNFSIYPASASLSGAGESTTLKIITSKSTSYEVSTDVDWLTLGSVPSSGSASVTVTASTNPGVPRKGHVIVSETVNGVTLRNIMTVSQTINGMDVGVRDWENGDDEGGSVG